MDAISDNTNPKTNGKHRGINHDKIKLILEVDKKIYSTKSAFMELRV